jgi:hypothetical protein
LLGSPVPWDQTHGRGLPPQDLDRLPKGVNRLRVIAWAVEHVDQSTYAVDDRAQFMPRV